MYRVIPLSAHAAFVKAGFYLGMKVIEIPIDENTFEVNYDKMANAITKNTVLVTFITSLIDSRFCT